MQAAMESGSDAIVHTILTRLIARSERFTDLTAVGIGAAEVLLRRIVEIPDSHIPDGVGRSVGSLVDYLADFTARPRFDQDASTDCRAATGSCKPIITREDILEAADRIPAAISLPGN